MGKKISNVKILIFCFLNLFLIHAIINTISQVFFIYIFFMILEQQPKLKKNKQTQNTFLGEKGGIDPLYFVYFSPVKYRDRAILRWKDKLFNWINMES